MNKVIGTMRIAIALLVLVVLPNASLADTIQYTFNGYIDNSIPGLTNVWNGPGPEPTTFQMTFDVNTLAPTNSVSYTFGPSPVGPSIESINASFIATNFSLMVDGSPVLQSATASFGFSGTPLGQSTNFGGSYIGGFYSAGTQAANFFGNPDFGLSAVTQAQLLASNDPLGLMLNGSSFGTDDFVQFNYEGSSLYGNVSGEGTLVASPVPVPLPSTLSLLILGALMLGFVHRPRRQVSQPL